jgi:hypothetical protein
MLKAHMTPSAVRGLFARYARRDRPARRARESGGGGGGANAHTIDTHAAARPSLWRAIVGTALGRRPPRLANGADDERRADRPEVLRLHGPT